MAQQEIKVGDVFSSSFGYEQTNVCFYQVIGFRGKMVQVRRIESEKVYEASMSGKCRPVKDSFIKEEVHTKKLQYYSNRPTIKLSSCEYAELWDGKAKGFSEYA